jgi:hypothetical protein
MSKIFLRTFQTYQIPSRTSVQPRKPPLSICNRVVLFEAPGIRPLLQQVAYSRYEVYPGKGVARSHCLAK